MQSFILDTLSRLNPASRWSSGCDVSYTVHEASTVTTLTEGVRHLGSYILVIRV